MNNRILASYATLWKKGAETNRKATWEKSIIRCQWEPITGETRTVSGDMSAYSLELICLERGIKANDKLDYVDDPTKTSPTPNAYTVISVSEVFLGGVYHHTEVLAK